MDKRGVSIGLPLSLLHIMGPIAEKYDVEFIDRRMSDDVPLGDVVCVSAMTGNQVKDGLEVLKQAKADDNLTVIGGVHASLLPDQTLKHEDVDFVVVGDSYKALLECLNHIESTGSIKKIFRSCEQTPEYIPPAYSLMNNHPSDYFLNLYGSRNTLSLLCGRGCPHRCKYCYNSFYNKRKWTGYSVDTIIKRIKELISFGAQSVDLVDDNFFTDRKRVEELCNRIISEKIEIKIFTNCRADYIGKFSMDFLKLMKQAGFNELFVGVESGNQRVLDLMSKDLKIDQILEANRKLKEVGIRPVYSFMCGFPSETWEEVCDTIDLMLRLKKENPNASLTSLKIFTPFPGTEFYDVCAKEGMKFPESLDGWGDFDYNTSKFKNDPLLEKLSYVTYFLDQESMVNFTKNPLLKLAIKVYSKYVWFRCRVKWFGFMPEWRIIKWVKNR